MLPTKNATLSSIPIESEGVSYFVDLTNGDSFYFRPESSAYSVDLKNVTWRGLLGGLDLLRGQVKFSGLYKPQDSANAIFDF